MASGYSDEELLEGIKRGDKSAFDEVFNRYSAKLYVAAFKLIRDKEEARDIVITILNNLFTRDLSATTINLLSSYLYMAVRNRSLDYLRSKKRITEIKEGYKNQVELEAFSYEVEVELSSLLLKTVDKLPERSREVIVLYYLHGLKYREIAEKLEISPRSVENQLRFALDRLRKSLADKKFELGFILLIVSLLGSFLPLFCIGIFVYFI